MSHNGFIAHGYCLQWDFPLIVTYVITDALVALSYYSIPAALFFLAFKKKQTVPLQPLLILFGLFIAFCGGGHAIDILSLWKPVYWLKGIWNIGTASTSTITAIILLPKVLEFVRMPETAARLEREKNELAEKESLLRAVLDSTLEGMILTDGPGETLLYNAAATRILGSKEGEAPKIAWPGRRSPGEDLAHLPNGRIVERFTREVPEYGHLYVLRDITERRASEEKRLRLERIVQTMTQGFAIISAESGTIMATNPSFNRMYGRAEGEMISKKFDLLLDGSAEDSRAAANDMTSHAVREGFWEGEIHCRRGDGKTFIAHSRLSLHHEGDSRLLSMIQVDVTEQKRLEEEAQRFQEKMLETAKLESVGLLAGGIAHDFNNILTGILGNASLVYDQLSPSSPLRPRVRDVVKASERAGDLTRQLLAYAGKGRFLIETVEVNSLVHEIASLVLMAVPKNVEVSVRSGADIWVEADRGQLHQLLMNLIINGAEAIGIGDRSGGCVTVSAARERLDTDAIRALFGPEPLEAGEYVVIEVQDNGSGMSRDTMAHIFDPFYTTKFTGRGLGLAAALGIVRGHRGAIKVYSELRLGSTFRVYLPVATARALEERREPPAADLAGTGMVLVIDDEEAVRNTARNTLKFYGYQVLEAENGQRGVDIFQHNQPRISLVLLDLTMPVMGGEEALRRIREMNSRVPVILSSGFNESEALRRFGEANLSGFLQKPYTSAKLAEKVRRAMPDVIVAPSPSLE
jgi:two-component system, chemotaxis family, CheB/CheR fusion protein